METRPNTQTGKSKNSRTPQTITFRRQFQPNYKPYPGEKNDEPSKTVPDMSLTVKELLINHSRGIHSDIKVNDAQYFETEIPHFDDITEAIEHKEALAERIKEMEAAAKEEKQKVIEARKEALKKQKELEDLAAKKGETDPPQTPTEAPKED